MTPCDPMAVAVDWLDAYRATRINQIVGIHSPDAVIECACGGRGLLATSLHRNARARTPRPAYGRRRGSYLLSNQ
jgi:hypothetical protein